MGIKNLMKVLKTNTPNAIEKIELKELNNKIIGIDTSIILYQYIIALKSTGKEFIGLNNKSTAHIIGILSKTILYLKLNIIPVFVFDGTPSKLKLELLNQRHKHKQIALKKLENDDYTNEEKIKLLKQSTSISNDEILEVCEILKILGIPYIISPEESDSQLAYLSKNDLIDYVLTEDMDILTFGAKNILKNFNKKNMEVIYLELILKEGNITYDQFIDICILLGCDYTDTIGGIGYIKAWNEIKKYKSIEKLLINNNNIIQGKYKIPDNFKYQEVRDYFNNPKYIKISKNDIKLKKPNLDKLKNILLNKYGFNENNINNIIDFLKKKYNININNDIFLDD